MEKNDIHTTCLVYVESKQLPYDEIVDGRGWVDTQEEMKGKIEEYINHISKTVDEHQPFG